MLELTRVLSGCLAPIGALAIGLSIGLWGCTPVIEGWRDVSGISKNDPGPDAPFIKNLAEGEAAPYPNLASVPPPPARATSATERQKLTQTLLADRAAAAAAGDTTTIAASATAAAAPRPARAAPAAPGVAVAAPPAPVKTATAEPRDGAPQGVRHPAAEPAQPPPPESSLQTPEVRSLPEPEAARPAPPPLSLPAATRPAVASGPSPAALASVKPEAPPPLPTLAPPLPPPATGKPATKPAQTAPGLVTVAILTGPVAGGGQAEIASLAARYKEQPGRVRVVGYAAAPAAGGDPLASYQAALDRAQAVARALTAAGIPGAKIQTEATPAASTAGAGRVEVQFGP